jgi:hypothetical protein
MSSSVHTERKHTLMKLVQEPLDLAGTAEPSVSFPCVLMTESIRGGLRRRRDSGGEAGTVSVQVSLFVHTAWRVAEHPTS